MSSIGRSFTLASAPKPAIETIRPEAVADIGRAGRNADVVDACRRRLPLLLADRCAVQFQAIVFTTGAGRARAQPAALVCSAINSAASKIFSLTYDALVARNAKPHKRRLHQQALFQQWRGHETRKMGSRAMSANEPRQQTMTLALKGAVVAVILAMSFTAQVAAGPSTNAVAPPVEDAVAALNKDDFTTALRLFRQLAEMGNPRAQFNLGFMYANGRGVPTDFAEAMKWYRLAADQGFAAAQHNLGIMYANGQNVATDHVEAVKWYRLAANQGFAKAQNELGYDYAQGRGVPKDYDQALKWYRMAADQGDAGAQLNLGTLYATGQGVPQNHPEALKWFRLAADTGNAGAQFNLGLMYSNGLGTAKDPVEAAKWWRLAAEQSYAKAQLNLGTLYATGRGVPEDKVHAYLWFSLAAARGDLTALNYRNRVAQEMTPAQIAEAQKIAREWRPTRPAPQ